MNFADCFLFSIFPFFFLLLNVSHAINDKSYLKRKPILRYVFQVFEDIGSQCVQNNITSYHYLEFFLNLSLCYRASSQNIVFKILINLFMNRELYEIEIFFYENLQLKEKRLRRDVNFLTSKIIVVLIN